MSKLSYSSARAGIGTGRRSGTISSFGSLARRWGLRRVITHSRRDGHWISLLVLLLCLGLLAICFGSYRFYVYEADIRGNRLLPREKIYEISGLEGYSIFWINPREVATRLESSPYIREAEVDIGLPDRVQIYVQEREPIILWEQQGGAFWVDRDGVVMEPITELPTLIHLEDEQGEAGIGPQLVHPAIPKAIQSIHQLLPEVRAFYYNGRHGLQFTTPEGATVYLGSPADLEYKVRLFEAVRRQILEEGRSATLIDLRRRDELYIR
ncbi:MAG: hypothetical protein Kow0047_20200 [Anaerolineae bacterium]